MIDILPGTSPPSPPLRLLHRSYHLRYHFDMSAEEPIVSRLDNAGTLLQSATSNVPSEKISIVSPVHPAAHLVEWTRRSPTDRMQLPGHEPDYSACTFCLTHEDHTLGNALRWIIMKE